MQTPSRPVAPRKSAFAAAFFSFLFPGLGHAYLGRWSRALLWAALPILGVALIGGLLVNGSTRDTLLGLVLEPVVLVSLLGFLVFDLLYRLAALLDAYRLARAPASSTPVRSLLSGAGLLAVLAVLLGSHVAVARPVMIAYETFIDIGGDEAEGPSGPIDSGLLASFRPYTQPPTPSPVPGESVEPTPTPEPTPTQGPSWEEGGRLNILLIGADAGREGYSNYLTDTMILVSIDPKTKQVAFISLPRDTQNIPIPRSWKAYDAFGGVYPYKINTLYVNAAWYYPDLFPGEKKEKGYNALKGVLGELYDLEIDYYVAVDLSSFRDVINSLGGVMIDVQNPVYDYHYPADDGRGHIKLYVPPGIQYMRGNEALAYARARHLTSDFDRSARQMRVITSAAKQIDIPSLLAPGEIQALVQIVRRSIRTDFPPSKLPQLAQLGQEVDLDKRVSLVLDPPEYSEVCYPCPPDGLYILKANVSRIRRDVANIFRSDRAEVERAQVIKSEGAVVHVLNGTTNTNLKATRAADYLEGLGIDASVPPIKDGAADRDDYPGTVIIVYDGVEADMPETVRALQRTFDVRIQTAEDPEKDADIEVIIGQTSPLLRP